MPRIEDVVAVPRRLQGRHRVLEVLRIEGEGEVVDAAGLSPELSAVRGAVVADEHREDAPVAGVEEEVGLGGIIEVGLPEDQRHPQEVPVERDRVLGVAPPDRDVVGPRRPERAVGRLGCHRIVGHGATSPPIPKYLTAPV
jgi:hypothetical protein